MNDIYLTELADLDEKIKQCEATLFDLKEQRNRLSPEAKIMAQFCAVCVDTVGVGECFVFENTLFRVTARHNAARVEKPVVAESVTKGVFRHFFGSTQVLISKNMIRPIANKE